MILIKEVTAKELATLWANASKNNVFPEAVAQEVLNTLQVKSDVRPMTLPSEVPSFSLSYSANLDVSRSSGSEETKV